MKKKVKETKVEWNLMPGKFSIKEENMFAEDAKYIPVVVFIAVPTGEIKLFARHYVEKVGTESILAALNP